MSPTSTSQPARAGFWSVSCLNIFGTDGQRTIWRRCSLAKSGMSARLQPSGPWLVSPQSIQEVMASPAWSTFARPLLLFDIPLPRSYAYKTRIEVRSPVWRRWVECWEFSIEMPDAESVFPSLAIDCTRERAAPLSALHDNSTTPPTTRHTFDPSQRRPASVHARRPERQQQPSVREEAQRSSPVNYIFFTRKPYQWTESSAHDPPFY